MPLPPPPPLRTRASYRFFLPYRTRWSDNDQYGHLNNSVYNLLVDSVVNHYLIAECGLSPRPGSDETPIGLVVSSHCTYFASVSFPEVLDLGLRVNRLGRSSVAYEVGFFRAGEAAASAVGGFVHVFVGREGRRPVALGTVMREGLEKLLVDEGAELEGRGTEARNLVVEARHVAPKL